MTKLFNRMIKSYPEQPSPPLRHARRQKMIARRNFHVECSMSVSSVMGILRQRTFMILTSSSGYMKKWGC